VRGQSANVNGNLQTLVESTHTHTHTHTQANGAVIKGNGRRGAKNVTLRIRSVCPS